MLVQGIFLQCAVDGDLIAADVKGVFNRGGEIKNVNLFVFCLGGIMRGHYSIELFVVRLLLSGDSADRTLAHFVTHS